ncbi:hypothetical protein OF001_U10501 [Pseudomonas sp. OF001]|nr:hypothetical protein OF001_U10501 [Pseudomonas sp. OF001]
MQDSPHDSLEINHNTYIARQRPLYNARDRIP